MKILYNLRNSIYCDKRQCLSKISTRLNCLLVCQKIWQKTMKSRATTEFIVEQTKGIIFHSNLLMQNPIRVEWIA